MATPNKDGMSGYYAQQNCGKQNISIDLNAPGSLELALRLCDEADIVVENFRAGTLASFGLDYATLSARNPRLVYVSITGFGQGGPYRSRMAYAPSHATVGPLKGPALCNGCSAQGNALLSSLLQGACAVLYDGT